MGKKDDFKEFAKEHKELFDYVKEGKTTWQELYEMYDIYGEDNAVWDKYKEDKVTSTLRNIDVDKISGHLDEAKKVIDLLATLTKKDVPNVTNVVPEPKEINGFFKD